jgi:hypothetical protein
MMSSVKMTMSESDLQSKCIKHLRQLRIYHINIYGAGRCSKGAPDVIACIKGQFVAFEFKVGSNDMQSDQRIHRRRILSNDGLHFTPRTFEEFKKIVEEVSANGRIRVHNSE